MITVNAQMERKVEQFCTSKYQIGMVKVLPKAVYDSILRNPLIDRKVFLDFREKGSYDSKNHAQNCLLLLNDFDEDGLLVDTQGYDYARYACLAPGIRPNIEQEIRLAAMQLVDLIIDGSKDGFGFASFEEIEKECGFAVTEENGLLPILTEAIHDNEWVQDFEVTETGISIEVDPCVLKYQGNNPAMNL